jgi:hypothetical protein
VRMTSKSRASTRLPQLDLHEAGPTLGLRRSLNEKFAQGWPKSWAKLRAVIGIISQSVGQVVQFGPTLSNSPSSPRRYIKSHPPHIFR